MSYIFPVNKNSRLRIYKVPVGTPDNKTVADASDFNYEIKLPVAINNVITIELADWSFPRNIIPTFYPATTTLAGNNKLDFRLENPDISAVPADFTVTFPTKYFQYQNFDSPQFDYNVSVANLMNAQIDTNPTWAGKVNIELVPQAFQQTLVIISTIDTTLPNTSSTTLTFLFATGPNAPQSCHIVMGWPTAVDAVSNTTTFQLPPGSQAIESPNSVNLRSAAYIDIYVEESPQKPLQRIFFEDPSYTSNLYATDAAWRLEVDNENPPRKLEKLHINIRYEGDTNPGDFLTGPIIAPHYMTFHVVALSDETQDKPSYIKQNMVY